MCTCAPHLQGKDAMVLQKSIPPHTSYIVGNTAEPLYSGHQKFCSRVFQTWTSSKFLVGVAYVIKLLSTMWLHFSLSVRWQGMLVL